VEGALALVRADLAATGPEEWARCEVSPECVKLGVSFHGVTIPQTKRNQWISSLAVRLPHTRAAALAEIMIVV
jgi:hypothetical protein